MTPTVQFSKNTMSKAVFEYLTNVTLTALLYIFKSKFKFKSFILIKNELPEQIYQSFIFIDTGKEFSGFYGNALSSI